MTHIDIKHKHMLLLMKIKQKYAIISCILRRAEIDTIFHLYSYKHGALTLIFLFQFSINPNTNKR